jgi:hypothetical protein
MRAKMSESLRTAGQQPTFNEARHEAELALDEVREILAETEPVGPIAPLDDDRRHLDVGTLRYAGHVSRDAAESLSVALDWLTDAPDPEVWLAFVQRNPERAIEGGHDAE